MQVVSAKPEYPWTFDNDLFGGPDFWGLVNKDWRMCTYGQMQSPINVDPSQLLFDPNVRPLVVDKLPVSAILENVGQLPIITMNSSSNLPSVNISGGPLGSYRYRLHHILLHFGKAPEKQGSEHTIDGVRFPAEIQLLGYNSDLYRNFSEAMTQPRGLVGIAVMIDIGATTNYELKKLTVSSASITYKGMKSDLLDLIPSDLLSKTVHFVTYDGSLTYPGCYETVTWIVMNKPLYITVQDLHFWNDLQQTETKQSNPVFMSPNYRPLRDLNGRLLRTNINFQTRTSSNACPSMYTDMHYKANPNRIQSNRIGIDKRDVSSYVRDTVDYALDSSVNQLQ
uniref:Alpha-carbonic anhydrase domain-containing protein n=2 Tax=Plectus sambesii TaxID=2011161 RepID=A0A914XGS5_9BILA